LSFVYNTFYGEKRTKLQEGNMDEKRSDGLGSDMEQRVNTDESRAFEAVSKVSNSEQDKPTNKSSMKSAKREDIQVHSEQLLASLHGRLDEVQTTLSEILKSIKQLAQQQDLFPAKLRQLATKIDDITSSLAEPRIQDILKSLLLLHDIIEQNLCSMPKVENQNAEHRSNYEILLNQIIGILSSHGIEMVPTDVPFDPNLHKAIEQVECEDPSEDGKIVRVIRKGFKTKRLSLRYAEVVVAKYNVSVQTTSSSKLGGKAISENQSEAENNKQGHELQKPEDK